MHMMSYLLGGMKRMKILCTTGFARKARTAHAPERGPHNTPCRGKASSIAVHLDHVLVAQQGIHRGMLLT